MAVIASSGRQGQGLGQSPAGIEGRPGAPPRGRNLGGAADGGRDGREWRDGVRVRARSAAAFATALAFATFATVPIDLFLRGL